MVALATSCLPNHFIMIIAQARPQTVTSNPQVCLPVLGNYCLDRHRLSGHYPHWECFLGRLFCCLSYTVIHGGVETVHTKAPSQNVNHKYVHSLGLLLAISSSHRHLTTVYTQSNFCHSYIQICIQINYKH